jgi:hypothetical protein
MPRRSPTSTTRDLSPTPTPPYYAAVGAYMLDGFREVGVQRRHGRLDREWRDVLVVERSLARAGP